MPRFPSLSLLVRLLAAFAPLLLLGTVNLRAAAFSGNARIEIGDGLDWDSSKAALTVSCWFKLTIPTGTNLTENMTILVNRRSGDEGNPHAYQIRFNIYTGNIEFTTRGTSGAYTNTLIERPYLERWYHVAVVRSADVFTGYLDGRLAFTATASIGSSTSSDGASIGGWGSSKYLYGEVQEFAVHDSALSQEFIVQNMFANQPAIAGLKGYYKLGYSTNAADNLRNFASAGPGPGGVVGSGKVEFEESNQGGEQSAFDSRRNGGRDSLAPLSGAFSWEQTVFARPTPGIAFDFRVGYSSANAFGGFKLGGTDPYASGPLGAGWRHTFETRVLPSRTFSPLSDTDTVGLMMWNGAIETWDFDYDTGNYRTRSKEYKGELTFPTLQTCQWTTPERIVYTFKAPDRGNNLVMRGRLMSIRDFNSNTVELRWNENIGVITQIVDTARGVYDLSYNAQHLLSTVAFTNGSSVWLMNFGFDTTNRLASQSFANTSGLYTNVNTLWQFAYNNTNGLLERIVDPRGFTNNTVHYDQYGRKTNQVDALGRATVTKFGSPGKRQITHVDPGTNSWVETYDRKHRLLSQTDPLGQTTIYTYDAAGNRLSITEPLGYITYFGYDDRANVIAKTNAAGEVWRWSFHPFFNKATNDVNPLGWTNYFVYDETRGNLLRHYDGLGTLVTYAYETNGLVLVAVDANGNVSRFTYNTNGFLIAKTDPATNTTSFALNEVGWKLAETNALNQVATFAYDLNGRAVLAVDSLLRRFTNIFDANGNFLSANDGKGQLTRHFYDAANQKTQTVDRAGFTNLFFYTTRGKLDRATDALGNTATNFYDSANRRIRVSDPLGNTVTNTYDANGNLITFTDQVGQRFIKSYDRLNRVIAESDPLGNTRRTTYDPAGRVAVITTPNGYSSTHTYDGRGRLTQWVDAENFRWFYDYDPVGNITNITDALAGHYVMTYGPRNERLSELNQDGKRWTYVYDPLLRLSTQNDPNGTVRNLSYDVAGRVLSVGFSTFRTNSFNYDINNNPTNVSRLYQGTTTSTRLTYDVLDRATNQVDAFFQTVAYAYDALGRMTNLVYPGGKVLAHRYDALGRLTNQVDWAGRPMNYAYDRAGRLVSRTYPNGVVQTNTFDTAGRLTSLSYLTNSTAMIALTYAYDRNGNKNFMGEKGTFAWPQPTLTDDKSRFTSAGRLIDRQVETSTANPPTNSFLLTYRYDASGNLTNATGGGQTYTLAYDEDNRTTSIAWDNGLTAKTIGNRYDALGRRISRTLDGATTGYVLSLVGGMERILCDLNPDSTFTYYAHGPDLAYKEAADGTVTYYHADAQANIISLTAANAATVAQYAYTPYGRSLGSTNTLPAITFQPFNFVGSQGVMEELPGLYFMRARYYSADAGVFLSTDSVKNIGPGWKPEAYGYVLNTPLTSIDPEGNEGFLAAYKFEQKFIKPINQLLQVGVAMTDVYAGISTETEAQAELDHLLANHTWEKMGLKASLEMAGIPGAGLISGQFADKEKSSFGSTIANAVPTSQTGQAAFNFGRLIGNVVVGTVSRAFSGLFGSSGGASSSGATGAANQATSRNSVQAIAQNSPTSGTSGTTSSGGGSGSKITIKSGDTLSKIARDNGTSVDALLAANPQISDKNVIYAGGSVSLPPANTPPGTQSGSNSKGSTTSASSSKSSSAKGGAGKK